MDLLPVTYPTDLDLPATDPAATADALNSVRRCHALDPRILRVLCTNGTCGRSVSIRSTVPPLSCTFCGCPVIAHPARIPVRAVPCGTCGEPNDVTDTAREFLCWRCLAHTTLEAMP